MISSAELARRAAVKPPAITAAVKSGKLVKIIIDGKTGFDENSKDVVDYIESGSSQRKAKHPTGEPRAEKPTTAKPKTSTPARPRQESAPSVTTKPDADQPTGDEIDLDDDDSDITRGLELLGKNDLDKLKTREQIIKARIQNQAERRKYIPRDDVKRVFGRVYSVHTSIIRPLGSKIAPDLAALFGSTDDTLVLKVQEIIDSENYRALGMIKRELQAGLDRAEAGQLPGTDA